MLKDLAIILFIAFCVLLVYAAAVYEQYYPQADTVIERISAHHIQKLEINSTIVDQPLEQFIPELKVVDSKVEQKKQTVLYKKNKETIVEEVIEQWQEQEEEVYYAYWTDDYWNNSPSLVYYDESDLIYYQEDDEDYDIDYFDSDFVDYSWTSDFQRDEAVNNIVDYALGWVGVTPYVSWYNRQYSSLTQGTDCSGFVSLVYAEFGIETSAASDDYQYMSNTTYEQLVPGDIVVYGYGSHVAIYQGDDTIIHCSNEDVGTIESDMWYRDPTGYVHIGD